MRRSLSSCLRPRHLGVSIATSLCAGALLATPSLSPVYAAPTVGGDENGPQVQILQPGYQDVLKGKTKILIAVKAQKFNPQFVEMFIDDKPATTGPISLTTLPSAQYDWDTKLFTDGPHKLTVRITDTQGFRGWAEVNVYINNGKKVDALPPSLAWKNISGYQELSGKSQIQLSAVDNFGVKWIIVTVNPASEPNKKPALRSWLLNRPPYVVDFDTTKVDDGLYQLSAKAWDSFDQEGAAEALTVGVVNGSGINATTVGQMLQGMRKMETAKPETTKANPANKFTFDTPDESTATNIYNQRSGETKTATATKAASTASTPTASTPKVIVKQGAAASKTPLQPSAPSMIVRDTKPAVKTPVVVAKNTVGSEATLEVASPRLSTSSSASIQAGNPSSLRSEIEGAIADDYRERLARVAVPEGQFQNVPVALMSAPQSGDLSISRMAATSLSGDSGLSINAGRTAMPVGELRVAARPEKPVAAPALSSSQAKAGSLVAPRLAVAPQVEASVATPSRVASPTVEPQRSFEGAAFSGSTSSPSTRLSAKTPLLAKNETRKSAAAGKPA
ncbi:hypothetical protein EON80_01990, partial [bacterium]